MPVEEMAEELADGEGIPVRTLFIDDDVAVKDSTYTVGRRGVAGNFFVIKAVGAAAEGGADLDELVRIGEKANAATRTMGIALTARGGRWPSGRRTRPGRTATTTPQPGQTSIRTAPPWPPPAHMVARPRPPPRRRSS